MFFPLHRGQLGKDISCGWIIDDSPLFGVCVLWFYLLWFKGPKQCLRRTLITSVKSAPGTSCALRLLYPNLVISAQLRKAKSQTTVTLKNRRENLQLKLKAAHFPTHTKAEACINLHDNKATDHLRCLRGTDPSTDRSSPVTVITVKAIQRTSPR